MVSCISNNCAEYCGFCGDYCYLCNTNEPTYIFLFLTLIFGVSIIFFYIINRSVKNE